MREKTLTRYPQTARFGSNMSKEKYEAIRTSIITSFNTHGVLTFSQLAEAVECELTGKFDGSMTWDITTVKLDLEAKGIIQRIPKTIPHRLRLAG
jgi:hypothetical protein